MNDREPDQTTLSRRVDELQQELERLESQPPTGAPALVAKIVQEVTLPTAASKYFACKAQDVSGDEEEGATATFTDVSDDLIYAACLGPNKPAVGDKVLISMAGGRWSFGC